MFPENTPDKKSEEGNSKAHVTTIFGPFPCFKKMKLIRKRAENLN